MSYVEIETGRYIKRWAFWNPATWSIPKLYWNAWSQEQRTHAICRQLEKVIKYADYLGVNVDDIAARLKAIEDGQLDELIVAAIEAWFEENQPEIIQALEDLREDLDAETRAREEADETINTSISTLETNLTNRIDKMQKFVSIAYPEYVGMRRWMRNADGNTLMQGGCSVGNGQYATIFIDNANGDTLPATFLRFTESEILDEIETPVLGHCNSMAYKNGLFYIADYDSGKIKAYNRETNIVANEFNVSQYAPYAIAYDGANDEFYILNSDYSQSFIFYVFDGQFNYLRGFSIENDFSVSAANISFVEGVLFVITLKPNKIIAIIDEEVKQVINMECSVKAVSNMVEPEWLDGETLDTMMCGGLATSAEEWGSVTAFYKYDLVRNTSNKTETMPSLSNNRRASVYVDNSNNTNFKRNGTYANPFGSIYEALAVANIPGVEFLYIGVFDRGYTGQAVVLTDPVAKVIRIEAQDYTIGTEKPEFVGLSCTRCGIVSTNNVSFTPFEAGAHTGYSIHGIMTEQIQLHRNDQEFAIDTDSETTVFIGSGEVGTVVFTEDKTNIHGPIHIYNQRNISGLASTSKTNMGADGGHGYVNFVHGGTEVLTAPGTANNFDWYECVFPNYTLLANVKFTENGADHTVGIPLIASAAIYTEGSEYYWFNTGREYAVRVYMSTAVSNNVAHRVLNARVYKVGGSYLDAYITGIRRIFSS